MTVLLVSLQAAGAPKWKAAGSGGVEGCFGEHLAEGGLVSLHVGVV